MTEDAVFWENAWVCFAACSVLLFRIGGLLFVKTFTDAGALFQDMLLIRARALLLALKSKLLVNGAAQKNWDELIFALTVPLVKADVVKIFGSLRVTGFAAAGIV